MDQARLAALDWITLAAGRRADGRARLDLRLRDQQRTGPRCARTSRLRFEPDRRQLSPAINLAQLAIGVLGVLLVTGEYATGMIRATLAAVPRRLPVLWAKAVVFAARDLRADARRRRSSAFLLGQQVLGSARDHAVRPARVRAVDRRGRCYLTADRRCSPSALGFILRSTAGGIATLFGLLLVLPGLGQLLPATWQPTRPAVPAQQRRRRACTRCTPTRHAEHVDRLRGAVHLGRRRAAAGRVLLRRRDA